jgi:hypothetical protein
MQKSFLGGDRGTKPFHTSVQMTDNDSSKSLPSDDEDEHEEEYDDEISYGYNYFDIGEQLQGDRTYEIVRKIGYGFASNVWLASFPKQAFLLPIGHCTLNEILTVKHPRPKIIM